MNAKPSMIEHQPGQFRYRLTLLIVLGIALFFLIAEHRAQLLGLPPWLLVAACPLMHVFLHRGHGRRHSQPGYPSKDTAP